MYFDNSNIFHSQHSAGWRIDAKRLFEKLQERGEIWQTYFFAAVTDPPRFSQTNFYNMLKNDLHWETFIFPLGQKTHKCKECQSRWTSWSEKGLDVALATKLLTHGMNKAFDTAILASGDKDYLETVRTVKGFGLRVEIVAFRSSLSGDLGNESSAPVIYLDDVRDEIELVRPEAEVEELQAVGG
jgi:uncharacterized LabA/DUF88 family protein